MTRYDDVKLRLKRAPRTWAITGVAGFIGSNLLETLLKLDQCVIGLDNFSTGHQRNLDEAKQLVEPAQWARFDFIEGDVCAIEDCERVCKDADYVLASGRARVSDAKPRRSDRHQRNECNGLLEYAGGCPRRQGEALRLCVLEQHLWRSSGAAEGGGRNWETAEPLCGHEMRQRALRWCFCARLRTRYNRASLFQRVWPPTGPERAVCGGDSEMDVGDDRRPRSRHQRRRRDEPRLLLTSPTPCRRMCSRRPRTIARRSIRCTTSRSANAQASTISTPKFAGCWRPTTRISTRPSRSTARSGRATYGIA